MSREGSVPRRARERLETAQNMIYGRGLGKQCRSAETSAAEAFRLTREGCCAFDDDTPCSTLARPQPKESEYSGRTKWAWTNHASGARDREYRDSAGKKVWVAKEGAKRK